MTNEVSKNITLSPGLWEFFWFDTRNRERLTKPVYMEFIKQTEIPYIIPESIKDNKHASYEIRRIR